MDPVFQLSIAAGLSLLFASAAWHKLRSPARFREVLTAYELLPAGLAGPAAAALALTELAAAAAVWLGSLRTQALAVMVALLLLYWLAIAINLARGRRDIDCGCSGPRARQRLSGGLLVRNAVLIGLAAAAAAADAPARDLVWLDWFTVAAAVGVAALIYAAANRLLAQAPRLALLRRG